MSRYLPDVNVLIALVDPDHTFHDVAFRWISELGEGEWFTCPITENGAVRIVSGSGYGAGRVAVAEAIESVHTIRQLGHHRFVADDISITDSRHFAVGGIVSSRRLTDAYLVALAAVHDAVFVTLDSRLVKDGVAFDGARVLYLETGHAPD